MDDLLARLNLDLFHLVMSLADRCTVSRLMQTCRALNHEGARSIFLEDPQLDTGRNFKSFVRFTAARGDAAEVARRLERLRGLRVDLQEEDREAIVLAPLLKQFLVERALYLKNLVRLNINGLCDLIRVEPELPAAIAAMTTLRSLVIRRVEHRGLGMVRDLQSRLTHAVIALVGGTLDKLADRDLTVLLQRSRMTLRSLSYESVLKPVVSTSPACYPHVRHLSLNRAETLVTRNLVAVFPHLETLHASWLVLTPFPGDYDRVLVRHRTKNIAEQHQHGSWSSLRRFTGSLAMLYVLGLTCHVPHISVGIDENEGFEFGWARAIVEDTRPTHLTFDIGFPSYLANEEHLVEELTALFSQESLKDIEVLRVNLILYPGDLDLELGLLLDTFLEAIALCSAEAVALTVDSRMLSRGRFSRDSPEAPGAVEGYLRNFDAHALVIRLVEMAPFLRTVIISHDGWGYQSVTAQRGPDIAEMADADVDFDDVVRELQPPSDVPMPEWPECVPLDAGVAGAANGNDSDDSDEESDGRGGGEITPELLNFQYPSLDSFALSSYARPIARINLWDE
ncbi:hypothetical protein OH76DRAFT_1482395 [Lentinus brumalis]|uniref:F-box domain-containing protein n=1 Tax=Lentinus brumalis TaxID=2498619 RepID=A0A371DCG6_9APHY|nr:hypothetical protein OH76DRAFT_1482395 [Polyporus brumalis]